MAPVHNEIRKQYNVLDTSKKSFKFGTCREISMEKWKNKRRVVDVADAHTDIFQEIQNGKHSFSSGFDLKRICFVLDATSWARFLELDA